MFITLLIILVLSVTIFQDYLHSRRNNYAFYISESLLFNTLWLLFYPIALFLFFLFKRISIVSDFKNPYLKASIFIVVASILHMMLYPVVVFVLSSLLFTHTYTVNKNLSYTLSQDFYKYIFVYGAIAYFYFWRLHNKDHRSTEHTDSTSHKPLNRIILGTGRNNIALPTTDIFFISASSPYISINTIDKKLLHLDTLKSISEKLDKNQFIRIHKSTIVNLDKIVSYKSRLNGDYDILLSNGQELRLSRNYVNTFRQHIEKRHPSS